jgi:hypothetical protein
MYIVKIGLHIYIHASLKTFLQQQQKRSGQNEDVLFLSTKKNTTIIKANGFSFFEANIFTLFLAGDRQLYILQTGVVVDLCLPSLFIVL